jgi:hypothetical protein
MNYEESITNYELRKMNSQLRKMRNNKRRNNQTNQGCVGGNLRVYPAMVNTIPIIINQLRKDVHADTQFRQNNKTNINK